MSASEQLACLRAALLPLLLAACFGGGGSKPPAPKPQPPVPARTLPVLGLGTHSLEPAAIAALDSLGVRYVRHTLYAPLWADHPTYAITFRENVARAKGFRLLLVVHPLPEGWSPERFGALMGELAREFPQVDAWQIGNEEMFGGSVQAHAAYHRAAYDSVKANDPDARVVSMAWTHMHDARAFARLAKFDALAVHVYGYPVSAVARQWAPLARDHGVWATEFGFQPPQLPPGWTGDWEAEQAKQWREAVAQMGASGFVRGYGYQLQTEEPIERHGVLRPDGTWRPAAAWVRSVLR